MLPTYFFSNAFFAFHRVDRMIDRALRVGLALEVDGRGGQVCFLVKPQTKLSMGT